MALLTLARHGDEVACPPDAEPPPHASPRTLCGDSHVSQVTTPHSATRSRAPDAPTSNRECLPLRRPHRLRTLHKASAPGSAPRCPQLTRARYASHRPA